MNPNTADLVQALTRLEDGALVWASTGAPAGGELRGMGGKCIAVFGLRVPLTEALRAHTRAQASRLPPLRGGHPGAKRGPYPGVTKAKDSKKWRVSIYFRGCMNYAGLFSDVDEAIEAAKRKREELGCPVVE